ncbi:hypothetical protein DN756_04610 [Yersinia pseudotuberculosis]|nr:hypothetical protein EGX87_07195 [Yersinia pseudotuberculosis]AYX01591.1 hypothetical protein EGX53_18190 [Yersinia pseudotuberculosis]AZA29345.1 hypothetical protein DN756_04610 [Yersinia pseudotuberculosis]
MRDHQHWRGSAWAFAALANCNKSSIYFVQVRWACAFYVPILLRRDIYVMWFTGGQWRAYAVC